MQQSDEDNVLELSAETLAALQEFYVERDKKLAVAAKSPGAELFDEDWQLSQFWYDEDTVATLVDATLFSLNSVAKPLRVALVSCPTLYRLMKASCDTSQTSVNVFEFDRRFQAFGDDYVFYDYNQPLVFSKPIEPNSYDIVVADPPFISEECLSKVLETVRHLSAVGGKVIICTGDKMGEFLLAKRPDMRRCAFRPRHVNNLANEFGCYATFDLDDCHSA